MIRIENELLRVEIDPVGVEYASIQRKDTGIEYLWQGDPAYWKSRSPLLFPFVGTCRNDCYTYQGKAYPMVHHGYARNMLFEITEQTADKVTFRHSSNEETRKIYPFDYELYVTYEVKEKTLFCEFELQNLTDGDMYFSLGGHPGIRVPLLDGETWADYRIRFEKKETAFRWVYRDGGFQWQTEPCLEDSDTLEIDPHLFDQDAIVFKGMESRTVSFEGVKNGHRVTMDFHRFPTIALWSAKPNAPFICMEPWFSHADMADHDGELTHKVDVQHLLPDERFRTGYTLTLD